MGTTTAAAVALAAMLAQGTTQPVHTALKALPGVVSVEQRAVMVEETDRTELVGRKTDRLADRELDIKERELEHRERALDVAERTNTAWAVVGVICGIVIIGSTVALYATKPWEPSY